MKNIVNIVIIGLLVIVLIISGSLYLNHKENENNIYNEDIIEVVMKTINGKYDIEEINSLDCEDWLKNSLKDYYNDNFFNIFPKIEHLNIYINEGAEAKCTVRICFVKSLADKWRNLKTSR